MRFDLQSCPPPCCGASSAHSSSTPSPDGSTIATLPKEMHDQICNYLDEDSLANLGGTSRYWSDLVARQVYPPGVDARQAVREGRRHLLGRLWQTPQHGADMIVGARDTDSMTVMMHAAASGDVKLLRCLMRHVGSRLNQVDRARLNALDWAALSGHIEAFANAVRSNPKPLVVGFLHAERITLHDAVDAGHWQLFRKLLKPHWCRLDPSRHVLSPRPGYRLEHRLTCGLTAVHCAGQHAPSKWMIAAPLAALGVAAGMTPEQVGVVVGYINADRAPHVP